MTWKWALHQMSALILTPAGIGRGLREAVSYVGEETPHWVLTRNFTLVWKWLIRATFLQIPATLGTNNLDITPASGLPVCVTLVSYFTFLNLTVPSSEQSLIAVPSTF